MTVKNKLIKIWRKDQKRPKELDQRKCQKRDYNKGSNSKMTIKENVYTISYEITFYDKKEGIIFSIKLNNSKYFFETYAENISIGW